MVVQGRKEAERDEPVEGDEMSVRKKLNGMYMGGAAVLAAFVGLVFTSWLAFSVTLVVVAGVQWIAGNIRFASVYR